MKIPELPVHFILPDQPDPEDTRPRNAFGYLHDFGKAYHDYYERIIKAEDSDAILSSDANSPSP